MSIAQITRLQLFFHQGQPEGIPFCERYVRYRSILGIAVHQVDDMFELPALRMLTGRIIRQ